MSFTLPPSARFPPAPLPPHLSGTGLRRPRDELPRSFQCHSLSLDVVVMSEPQLIMGWFMENE
ncbi:hypothetical protein E2C01_036387 [Portunus trituberculatus]|uniref:Uncharacterized protein n=1 Tax=Portunus trituberculatus TaxID=210409 RepID=A0A5B7FBR9_PORTR|nr:hypothetical protein [Portunus trituberculatus]